MSMSIKEAPNSSIFANFSTSSPLSVVAVCLDQETWQVLRQFAESAPLIRLRSQLSDYRVQDGEPLNYYLGDPIPDVCILDFDRDRRKAAATAEIIRSSFPEIAIFAVSSEAHPELIIEAMRSGCSEYLLKPVGREQLLNAMARVGGRRRERTQSYRAQVWSFMGAKGGCGVTSLVTQLGALLASTLSRKTLLVDLHPSFGDAALYLGLTKYKYHFFELVENHERLDSQLLQSFLGHHSSGLELIPAPEGSDAARRIVPGAMAQTLDFLRTRYDYVLVDMPSGLTDENLEMIRQCDQVHIVTVAEVSALRNVVRYQEQLTRREKPGEQVRIILNRYQKRALIAENEIERTIGQKIYWKVPNHYAHVVKAINGGDILADVSSSEYSKSLKDLAAALGAKPSTDDRRKGFLGLLGRS